MGHHEDTNWPFCEIQTELQRREEQYEHDEYDDDDENSSVLVRVWSCPGELGVPTDTGESVRQLAAMTISWLSNFSRLDHVLESILRILRTR
jgi:hypothetical protein